MSESNSFLNNSVVRLISPKEVEREICSLVEIDGTVRWDSVEVECPEILMVCSEQLDDEESEVATREQSLRMEKISRHLWRAATRAHAVRKEGRIFSGGLIESTSFFKAQELQDGNHQRASILLLTSALDRALGDIIFSSSPKSVIPRKIRLSLVHPAVVKSIGISACGSLCSLLPSSCS